MLHFSVIFSCHLSNLKQVQISQNTITIFCSKRADLHQNPSICVLKICIILCSNLESLFKLSFKLSKLTQTFPIFYQNAEDLYQELLVQQSIQTIRPNMPSIGTVSTLLPSALANESKSRSSKSIWNRLHRVRTILSKFKTRMLTRESRCVDRVNHTFLLVVALY